MPRVHPAAAQRQAKVWQRSVVAPAGAAATAATAALSAVLTRSGPRRCRLWDGFDRGRGWGLGRGWGRGKRGVVTVSVVVVVRLGSVTTRWGVEFTDGASRTPAEIGSEERPMRWLVSWLLAQVIPAVSAIPSSAASTHTSDLRLMSSTLETGGLWNGKAVPPPLAGAGRSSPRSVRGGEALRKRHYRQRTAAVTVAVLERHLSPHSRASSRAMCRPRPVPAGPRRPAVPRWKRSKIASCSSAAIPGPWSRTSILPGALTIVTTVSAGE